MSILSSYEAIIQSVSNIDSVSSIGKSGGVRIPVNGESDIDVFVFCRNEPTVIERRAMLNNLGSLINRYNLSETKGGSWGICDFVYLQNTEICLMYFTIEDINAEIESVLNGSRITRENEYFYPTGRCSSILHMAILLDKDNYLKSLKNKLVKYPDKLREGIISCYRNKINDEEDFDRAVSRGDVLFYHATLELAIDHFLQMLFAINRCYFPSRKRSLEFIGNFELKPADCESRLLKMIRLGSDESTLADSYTIWSALCIDILNLS